MHISLGLISCLLLGYSAIYGIMSIITYYCDKHLDKKELTEEIQEYK